MPKPGTDKDKKNSDSKDKKDENKPGFFKKIWGSVFDKKKDEKKEDKDANKESKKGTE